VADDSDRTGGCKKMIEDEDGVLRGRFKMVSLYYRMTTGTHKTGEPNPEGKLCRTLPGLSPDDPGEFAEQTLDVLTPEEAQNRIDEMYDYYVLGKG
jgi:hypothetical protein